MAIVVKNAYEVRFVDTAVKSCLAGSMAAICKAYEAPAKPISQIVLVRANVESITDDPVYPVSFTVLVTPQTALDAKCVGTPGAFTVEDGEEVIFQAIAATGFNFVGWYLGTTLLSASAVAKLPVEAPAIAGQTVQFEARFVAA